MNEKITVELSKREIILIEQAIGDLYDYCTDDDEANELSDIYNKLQRGQCKKFRIVEVLP